MTILGFLKKFLPRHRPQATIIGRSDHTLSRSQISENALKVLYRLDKAGYESYLVGGCVRDLLIGNSPKDFDVATNAKPEQIKKLFVNCRLIGRRFRLAHVHFRGDIIEVATFRRGHDDAKHHQAHMEDGIIVRDNAYGKLDEDAIRRDFTINALYYNIHDFSIVDFTGGLTDLQQKLIRMIGNPIERFREDPARILRAIRFASQLGFTIESKTEAAMIESLPLLASISPSRLFLEFIKLFHKGYASDTLKTLIHYRILEQLCPISSALLTEHCSLFNQLCHNTDTRIREDKPVSAGFLFSVLLWPVIMAETKRLKRHHPPNRIMEMAAEKVWREQSKKMSVPKQFVQMSREVWQLQHGLLKRNPLHIKNLVSNRRFRAAFDLLCLRAQNKEPVQQAAEWWQTYQTVSLEQQEQMIAAQADFYTQKNRAKAG